MSRRKAKKPGKAKAPARSRTRTSKAKADAAKLAAQPIVGSELASLFRDCDAEHVFAEVTAKMDSPQLRSLWQRLQAEMKRNGVGSALTYVNGEFDRLEQEFKAELSRGEIEGL